MGGDAIPFPGLPRPNPSISYWQSRTRASPLLSLRSTADLPATADAVVIGSGFTGAMAAHTLLTDPAVGEDVRPKKVVMLEAREFCSGATARNGGHTRPVRFGTYLEYKEIWGKEQSIKIVHHERDNYIAMQELVKGIDCDAEFHHTFDAYTTQKSLDAALQSYSDFVKDGGDVSDVELIDDPKEAARRTRCSEAQGAAYWPAGSVFPFKLAEGLVKPLLDRGLNLQTHTPAQSITGASGAWSIETPRGSIQTPLVIHATNGFAAALLPQLARHATLAPYRGQCSAQVPPAAFAGAGLMADSVCVFPETPGRSSGYLLQRRADGAVIVGGGHGSATEVPNNVRDDEAPADGEQYLAEFLPSTLRDWKVERHGEGLERSWTGISGFTKDHVPLIGAVPGLPGQFCCVGHNGHCMARIATAGRAIGLLATGRPWSDTGLPECFEITQERLDKVVPNAILPRP